MVDVHKDPCIYLEDPDPIVPQPKSKKSRKPTKLEVQTILMRVGKWAVMSLTLADWFVIQVKVFSSFMITWITSSRPNRLDGNG